MKFSAYSLLSRLGLKVKQLPETLSRAENYEVAKLVATPKSNRGGFFTNSTGGSILKRSFVLIGFSFRIGFGEAILWGIIRKAE